MIFHRQERPGRLRRHAIAVACAVLVLDASTLLVAAPGARRRVGVERKADALTGAGVIATGTNPVCEPPPPSTFTVALPKLGLPPDDEGQGWDRPPVWEHHPDATDDSISVPNGRPIYALIVSGFGSNKYLDELMVYDFARHLMAQGAYVHYSWWNNLLAPYMARPLHHAQSHPGGVSFEALGAFASAEAASEKAVPGEDYQFLADARRFLAAVREHNPSATIVVVGHSMGGGAVVHLGAQADVVLDLLAPLDPCGNRNYPWGGPSALVPTLPYANWTRWRMSRDDFLGFRSVEFMGLSEGCVVVGPWLKDVNDIANSALCGGPAVVTYHDAPALRFGPRVVNLHHRYQGEFLFPFDYGEDYTFGHAPPPGGSTSQAEIAMTPEFCGLALCSDPGGWPLLGDLDEQCCVSGDGVGWPRDGHGELIGYRGPITEGPVPLALRVRTSPQCGDECFDPSWPSRTLDDDTWSTGDSARRVGLLQDLETLPAGASWLHRPVNPGLCLVSPGLIQRFDTMNRSPVADAGGDQVVECDGSHSAQVTLDGSASSDPDGDPLEYRWSWPTGSASDPITTVTLPLGVHCVTLTVEDPTGHIATDVVTIEVVDTTPPELSVALTPRLLWPPNHRMVEIQAEVEATDLCGDVVELELVSIVSNQPDNGGGDGNTTGDIVAEVGTLDLLFGLRAERAGPATDRIYTVTYQATDDAGNRREVAVDVIVPHDARSYRHWREKLE